MHGRRRLKACSSHPSALLSAALLLVSFLLFGANLCNAATCTWTGGHATSDDWTQDANWGGTAPVAGDDLVFDGGTRLTPNNNFAADTSFNSITFNVGASSFTLGGERITLAGSITNNSANLQTISLNIIQVAWQPSAVSPAGWYDASDASTITQAGGAVSQWADKSGHALHLAQGTGSKQPLTGSHTIGGKNAIYFNSASSQDMKTSSNPFSPTINNAFVIFALNCRTITASTLFTLSGSGTSGNRWQSHAPWDNGSIYFDTGGTGGANRVSAASGWAASSNHLVSYYGSTADSVQQVYKDGSLLVGDATGHAVATVGNIYLGSEVASAYDNVDIGEWIIVNGTVSAANRQKLEGYLANKWGLTASLPASHPYKTNAPYLGLSINAASGDITITGTVTGSGDVTKLGTNKVTFSNATITAPGADILANGGGTSTTEFLGTTTVSANYLRVSINDAGNTVNIGGTAALTLGDFQIGEQPTREGTVNQTGGTVTVSNIVRVGHWATETSTYNLSAGTLNLTGTSATNPYQGGAPEYNGALYLGIDGTGNFNQSGGTVAAEGLVLDNRSDTAGTDTYTLTGGALTLGKWGIQGNASSQIDLGGGTVGASANWSSSRPMTLTGTGGDTTFDTGANIITLSGALSSTGGLIKAGTGALALSTTNTYTGATTINAGTLLVNGSTHADSAVAVNNGGTLGGTGTVSGAITLASGGTVAPGSAAGVSIGTFNTPALTFVSGSTYSVDLNGATPTFDKINSTGTVDCGSGTLTVANVASMAVGKAYTIISAGTVTGTFNGMADGSTFTQQSRTFRIIYTTTTVRLVDVGATGGVVWTGGDVDDDNWSSGANWSGGVAPTTGDNIVFDGSTRLTPNNDIVAGSFGSITFSESAGAFTVGGNALTLTGGSTALVNNAASGTQTFSCPLTFSTSAPTISTVSGGTLTVGGTIDNGGLLLTVNAAGPVNLGGVISNTGGLTKTGSNTLTLSGASTYGGTTTLSAGTLTLSGGNDRLPTTTTLALTGGTTTFALGSNNQTLYTITTTDLITTTLTVTGSGSATLTLNGDVSFIWGTGGVFLASYTYTLDMQGLPNFVFNAAGREFGVQYKSGANNLTHAGPANSTVILAANNTITCATLSVGQSAANSNGGTHLLRLGTTNTINANTVRVATAGRSSGTINFLNAGSSATFRATDGTSAVTAVNLGLASTMNTTLYTATADFSNGTVDFQAVNMTLGVADTLGTANRRANIVGSFLMGNGTLTVTGTMLLGKSASTGGGSINGGFYATGTLTINHASAVVSIATLTLAENTVTAGGGTRTVSGTVNLTDGTLLVTTLQKGAQTGTATATTAFNWTTGTIKNIAGADLTWTTIPITLLSGTHTFDIESGRTAALNSGSPIGGAFTLAKAGAGNLTLAGVNTYSGATTISAGNLDILGAGQLASGTYSANISIASGSVFTYNSSANQTLQTGVIGGAGALVKNDTSTLTLTGMNTYTGTTTISGGILVIGGAGQLGSGTYSADISIAGGCTFNYNSTANQTLQTGVISGAGALTKNNTGTLALAGANTYTGATTVNAGTLLVNAPGSLVVDSAVAVNNGGTLGGDGTVSGAITLASGGTVAPGPAAGVSIDTLNTANVTFVSGSTYSVDLDGTTPMYDQLNSSGTVDCTSATLKLASIANAADIKVYTIIQAASVTGEFNGLPDGASVEQLGRVFKITYTPTTVVLTDLTDRVWDGGGGDANWTTAANWVGNIAPVTGSALYFAGTVQPTTDNDFDADTRFASITFNNLAAAFTLGGNRITLTGDITNNDDSLQTIDLDIIRTSDTVWASNPLSTAAWYDAADASTITQSGGLVSQWNDKSGNSSDLTQTNNTYKPVTNSRTINGLNVLDFANNQVLGNTAVSLSSANISAFSVIQLDDVASTGDRVWALVNSTEANGLINRSVTSVGQRFLENAAVIVTPTTNPEIISYVKAGTASQKAWQNGTALTEITTTVTTFTIQAINAGAQRKLDPPWVPMDGAIAEIVFCTSALSDADRQKIEGYLANKWGLAASLPATHPYRALGVNAASGDITINGIISGSLGLVKQGAYTATLSGANTYTGKTSIQNGIVSVNTLKNANGTASALGAPTTVATGTIAIGSTTTAATLVYTGTGDVSNRVIDLAGTTGGATIDQSGSGLLQFTSAFTATGSGAKTLTLQGSTAGTGEVAGAIVDSASATALTKAGSGTWTLSGVTTHTGQMDVAGGTLTLSGARVAACGQIGVYGGGMLNISNGSYALGTNAFYVGMTTDGTVNQTGGSVSFSGASGQLLIGNGTSGTGTYNLSAGSLTTSVSANRGIILGVNSGTTGIFNLSGTGVLQMTSGGNSTLQIGRYDGAANSTVSQFNQTGGTATIGDLSIGGNGATSTGLSCTMSLSAGTFSAASFPRLAAGNTNTAVINISGTADVTLPAFPTARGTSSTATLNFDGGTLRPAAASATYISALTNAFIKANGANIDVASGRDITITQALLTDAVSLGGGLTKAGVGQLTLTGVNTYTGATTVNAGTLLVSGATDAGSTVTVNIGGSLGGTGTINGPIAMAAGGTLAPGMGGTNIGTLNTNAIMMNSGSDFSVDLDGTVPTFDQANSGSTVTCAGTLTVASVANMANNKVFTIVNATTGVTGTFNGLSDGALFTQQGRTFRINYNTGTDPKTVTLTDVFHIATRIWDGGGADNNWTTAANWDGDIAPAIGDDLIFAGTTRLAPNNDFFPDSRFARITFNAGAGAFTIGGNRITIEGDITNNDDSLQTITLDIIRTSDAVWTPSLISTYAWYDASDATTITQSGGAVSQWNDKSGNALHLAQAGANKPTTGTRAINGVNAVDFDGTDDLILRAGGMPDGDVMVFGVTNADVSAGPWLGNAGSGGAKSRTYLGDSYVDFGNAALAFSPVLSTGVSYIIMGQVNDLGDASTQGYRINGGTLTTGSVQRAVPQTSMAIGGNAGGISPFNGIVGEVVVVTSLLSNANRQKIEGYLANKWGLTANLPAGAIPKDGQCDGRKVTSIG